ncbi:TetR/AcrR family transcriptional regulator [Subtercola sp. RTI3]|uniref:TetR/AcrR family transcriptional regulator n=1 Tax=Subtercola sp. RTI3 TaxID=3048639 RepID=UPI002B22DA5B|nr:TetR/AcrR family transcriptional regulator [Subtercola sp. RTI3]MEA9985967.1 TetR/AcrR family transcriptional regulator [Subtercola sp. RTI3]
MGEAKTRRGPYRKGLAQRKQVLDVAMDLFAREGEAGTTLSAIAAAAGMTREGLRHYFSSRDDVLLAIVESVDEDARARQPDQTLGLFEQIIDSARRNAAVPGLSALFATLAARAVIERDSAIAHSMNGRLDQLRRDVTDGVRTAQDAGAIRTDIAPEVAASLILAVSDGLTIQAALPNAVDVLGGMRVLETLLKTRPIAMSKPGSPLSEPPSTTRQTQL